MWHCFRGTSGKTAVYITPENWLRHISLMNQMHLNYFGGLKGSCNDHELFNNDSTIRRPIIGKNIILKSLAELL